MINSHPQGDVNTKEYTILIHQSHRKGKAVPLQAWTCPEGSRKLRFPDFVTTAQDGGRLSAKRTSRLYTQEMFLVFISVMPDERVVKSIYKWKPHATRLKGRPRLGWDNDVRDNLRKMGVNNWKQKAQERKPWRGITEQAKSHKEL